MNTLSVNGIFCLSLIIALATRENFAQAEKNDLFSAIHKQNCDKVKYLLSTNKDLIHTHADDEYSSSPLATAIACDAYEITQCLIQHNANVNEQDNLYKYTPLHWAIKHNRLAILQLLIDASANPNIKENSQNNSLEYALLMYANKSCSSIRPFKNMSSIIKILINAGALINSSQRHSILQFTQAAIRKNAVHILQDLFKAGLNITQCDDSYRYSEPFLHTALSYRAPVIIRMLIKEGANVNVQDFVNYNQTPLHLALQLHHPILVRILVNNHARLDVQNFHDTTALNLIAMPTYAVTFACAGGACPLPQNKRLNIPAIAQEIMNGNLDAVTSYCDNPENLSSINNHFSKNRITLLMIAAAQGHQDIVQLLLDKGADPLALGYDKPPKQQLPLRFNVFDILNVILEDSTLSLQQRASYENIVQLCSNCYRKDKDSYLHELPIPVFQHALSFAVGMSLLSLSATKNFTT